MTVPIRDQIVSALETELHAKPGTDNVLQYADAADPGNLCTVAGILTTKTDLLVLQRAGVSLASDPAGDAGIKVIGSKSSAGCVTAATPILAELHP